MHLAAKSGEFTFANYMNWPENERWQLLDGTAYAMAPPSWAHQSVVTELGRQLGNALHGKPCQARVAPVGVRLPQHNEADASIRTVLSRIFWLCAIAVKLMPKGCAVRRTLLLKCCCPAPPVSIRSINAKPTRKPVCRSCGWSISAMV